MGDFINVYKNIGNIDHGYNNMSLNDSLCGGNKKRNKVKRNNVKTRNKVKCNNVKRNNVKTKNY